jgi:hypothetical protein
MRAEARTTATVLPQFSGKLTPWACKDVVGSDDRIQATRSCDPGGPTGSGRHSVFRDRARRRPVSRGRQNWKESAMDPELCERVGRRRSLRTALAGSALVSLTIATIVWIVSS